MANVNRIIAEVVEMIIGEQKGQRNEEWYDDECKEAARLNNIAKQTIINRYTKKKQG